MEISKEAITLYLEPWQKRVIKDFVVAGALGGKRIKEISKMYVSLGKIHCPVSYKIPAKGMRRGDWVMYLNDEQMAMVHDATGARVPISSINVTDELIHSGAVAFG